MINFDIFVKERRGLSHLPAATRYLIAPLSILSTSKPLFFVVDSELLFEN